MIEAIGQYRILDAIGPGPLGDVYRARDTRAGRTVAVTIVADRIVADPEMRARFLQDARAAAAISHPNIVTIYEVAEEQDHVGLVQEFVKGESLKRVIGGRPLNSRRAVDLASQIAEALADAHASELVHGHLTAETIVVTPKGHAKIAGFGLGAWSASAPAAPAAGNLADLSSLGRILFEMLTGRAPKPGAAVPSAIDPSLPREIDPIVARALGKSGGYESAVTLAAELRAVGAILDVRHEASDAGVVIRRPGRSNARWVMAVLAALAIAAAVWWYFRLA